MLHECPSALTLQKIEIGRQSFSVDFYVRVSLNDQAEGNIKVFFDSVFEQFNNSREEIEKTIF